MAVKRTPKLCALLVAAKIVSMWDITFGHIVYSMIFPARVRAAAATDRGIPFANKGFPRSSVFWCIKTLVDTWNSGISSGATRRTQWYIAILAYSKSYQTIGSKFTGSENFLNH